jgi:phosphate transport system substrate-binding protein
MTEMKRRLSIYLLGVAALVSACNGPTGKPEPEDTATSGTVNIVSDESYTLIFETLEYTFESLYKNADVTIKYKPEAEALSDLIADSAKVVVLNRDLTAEEKKAFEQKNIYPKSIKIAEDAVALIVNPANIDSNLTVTQFTSILAGKDTTWSSISSANKAGSIKVVFDNKGSANARFIKDSLMKGEEFQKNVFAVNSNKEVIEYVSSHPSAIGVISVNWISDRDDTLSQSFLNKVKVVALANADKPGPEVSYYKPYQVYIKTREYPLTRSVYFINRQTRAGLGTGFVSFVAGEKGQRMILKSGLIPATMPVRVVQFH